MNFENTGDFICGRIELPATLAIDEQRTARLVDQLRFQHEVLTEIHELSDPKSKTPMQDRKMIRIKADVALRQAARSGLLLS